MKILHYKYPLISEKYCLFWQSKMVIEHSSEDKKCNQNNQKTEEEPQTEMNEIINNISKKTFPQQNKLKK